MTQGHPGLHRPLAIVILLAIGVFSLPVSALFLDGEGTENWILPAAFVAMGVIGAIVGSRAARCGRVAREHEQGPLWSERSSGWGWSCWERWSSSCSSTASTGPDRAPCDRPAAPRRTRPGAGTRRPREHPAPVAGGPRGSSPTPATERRRGCGCWPGSCSPRPVGRGPAADGSHRPARLASVPVGVRGRRPGDRDDRGHARTRCSATGTATSTYASRPTSSPGGRASRSPSRARARGRRDRRGPGRGSRHPPRPGERHRRHRDRDDAAAAPGRVPQRLPAPGERADPGRRGWPSCTPRSRPPIPTCSSSTCPRAPGTPPEQ